MIFEALHEATQQGEGEERVNTFERQATYTAAVELIAACSDLAAGSREDGDDVAAWARHLYMDRVHPAIIALEDGLGLGAEVFNIIGRQYMEGGPRSN